MNGITDASLKWVLITGAARRIGRAIALEMAAAGWGVVAHYRSHVDEALELVERIVDNGGAAFAVKANFSDEKAIDRMMQEAVEKTSGDLSAIVNNAAIFERDAEDANGQHLRVNFHAPVRLAETLYAHVVAGEGKRGGAVVNILDSVPPPQDFSVYWESKRRLAEETLAMARRMAPLVRVNGVALGAVLPSRNQTPENFARMAAATPLGKPVSPQHVGKAARFLIETESLIGTILPLDGGVGCSR